MKPSQVLLQRLAHSGSSTTLSIPLIFVLFSSRTTCIRYCRGPSYSLDSKWKLWPEETCRLLHTHFGETRWCMLSSVDVKSAIYMPAACFWCSSVLTSALTIFLFSVCRLQVRICMAFIHAKRSFRLASTSKFGARPEREMKTLLIYVV